MSWTAPLVPSAGAVRPRRERKPGCRYVNAEKNIFLAPCPLTALSLPGEPYPAWWGMVIFSTQMAPFSTSAFIRVISWWNRRGPQEPGLSQRTPSLSL